MLEFGHVDRIQYCLDRLEAVALSDYEVAIVGVALVIDVGVLTVDEINKVAAETYHISAERAENYITRAVHGGFLEQFEPKSRRVYSFPIPSSHSYIRCRGEFNLTLYELRKSYQERLGCV